MAIIYPFIYRKYVVYEGDIITSNLSIAVLLEDAFTKVDPIGRIDVSLKKMSSKAKGILAKVYRNLSGAFCFNELENGEYSLRIESEYYFPITNKITIEANQADTPRTNIKKRYLLMPKISYPFPNGATLVAGRVVAPNNPEPNEKPLPNARVLGNQMKPACFISYQYDDFLKKNEKGQEILKKYAIIIGDKICIYPGEISGEDQEELGEVFKELMNLAKPQVIGIARFSYSDYSEFLKNHLLKEYVLSKYENQRNGKICLNPGLIADLDQQEIDAEAMRVLQEKAGVQNLGDVCFTHRKYKEFISKYFLKDDALLALTRYEEEKANEINIDLEKISAEDLGKISKKAIDKLKEKVEIDTVSDENGEFVLFFKGLKNKKERVRIRIEKEDMQTEIFSDAEDSSTVYLKVTIP